MFETISSLDVTTDRLTARVLRSGSPLGTPVVFVHGNVSSSLFWQPTMAALPDSVDAVAIDLRGFGGSQTLPVDATRGVRDFSDDVASVIRALDLGASHLVGWSMGGGVVMQLALDHHELVASMTLVATVSPYGFGGTRGAGGERLSDQDAGCGGGGGNPDFIARLAAGDTTDESPTSPRSVFRNAYVANPADHAELEDLWVDSMLTTVTGEGNYPGDAGEASAWPGFGPGTRGVLNTMVPRYFDTSGIVDLAEKPPVLWVHGTRDAIVSDASAFDLNQLGALGAIPGWPGEEVAPPQPMVSQTRAVLARYAAAGGATREEEWDCGHSPHLECPEEFVAALLAHIS